MDNVKDMAEQNVGAAEGESTETTKRVKPSLSIDEEFVSFTQDIYNDIVRPFPVQVGKAISKKERQELNLRETTLVYGELEFRPLAICFEKIKKKYGRPSPFLMKDDLIVFQLEDITNF